MHCFFVYSFIISLVIYHSNIGVQLRRVTTCGYSQWSLFLIGFSRLSFRVSKSNFYRDGVSFVSLIKLTDSQNSHMVVVAGHVNHSIFWKNLAPISVSACEFGPT
jgi:uncharacterized membrane protein YhaH (DUF805 family)